MKSPTPFHDLTKFEQILSKLYATFVYAARENYLFPYKKDCTQFQTLTQKLYDTIRTIPPQNKSPIEIRISSQTFPIKPHHREPLQTIIENYLEKIYHLNTAYTLLEQCAEETITLDLIQGYTNSQGKLFSSSHLLFLLPIPSTQKSHPRYQRYECTQTNSTQWHTTNHPPTHFENAISQVHTGSTIFLVNNPQQLPLLHTVEYIAMQKYLKLIQEKKNALD